MAHAIYQVNGKDSMAYVGATPWHKLGQVLTQGAPLETWRREAGLDWELKRSGVQFWGDLGDGSELMDMDGWDVLYRSDNGAPLSVVSDRYQEVQPGQILEFFEQWTKAGDMTMETAGVLGDGGKIWALARIGDDFNVNGQNGQDLVKPYMLLATSCDKTMATTGQLTSVRVVCNNTLQLALGKGGKASVKVPHSTKFNPDEVKRQMGLVHGAIEQHQGNMQKIHRMKMSEEGAMRFFLELLKTPEEKKTGEVDLESKTRSMGKIWTSYTEAPGAEATAWGLVNAITHSVDFNPSARSDSSRLNSAWFGQGAGMKQKAYELALDDQFMSQVVEVTQDDAEGLIGDLLSRPANVA
jgi:phage/plasmid-like protein (TIGR03299 family)